MPEYLDRLSVRLLAVLICLQFGACATSETVPDAPPAERSPADPWEPMNRHLYRGTTALDRVTFKPLAKGYKKVIPNFIQRGITNFSKNLRAPLHIINHFLQGKPRDGFGQTGRFLFNSTFGLGGLIDVATIEGFDQKREDFGQTLAVWGVPNGPYIVIPFLGPSTLRDATMLPLDFLADPLLHYENASVRDKIYFVRMVDVRARLLKAEALIKNSYDPYITLREAYLQRRLYLIYDGDPPEGDDFDEEFPDPE